jgi:hypothetical protein
MKATKLVFMGLLVAFLVFVPVIADAHWGFGGGAILGFGLGLFTGFAFAPWPVYVAPPVYYAPPPPVAYPYRAPAPVPPSPAASGYQSYCWYYCQNPQGYYPYIRSCPGGWLTVVPNVTPPNQ